jgi:hypothetical protein
LTGIHTNPILLNIEKNGPFLPISISPLKFSKTYQTLNPTEGNLGSCSLCKVKVFFGLVLSSLWEVGRRRQRAVQNLRSCWWVASNLEYLISLSTDLASVCRIINLLRILNFGIGLLNFWKIQHRQYIIYSTYIDEHHTKALRFGCSELAPTSPPIGFSVH